MLHEDNVPSIAVIIPYFQTKPGTLRRAMTSLLNQSLSPRIARIDIVLVDDGSPVPFQDEVAGLNIILPFNLRAVKQPNTGVAGARNTALRSLASDITYIAFLDSDDVWSPSHLVTAVNALEKGYDFYFCDGRRINDPNSCFTESITEPSFHEFLSGPHAHPIGERLFELDCEAFRGKALRAPAYRIPAVAYRKDIAPSLIFEVGLREVGEDSLFLLQLIANSRKICCSSEELALFADGINIFASTFGWDSPGHLMRYFGTILYYYRVLKTLPLSKDDVDLVLMRTRMYRRVFTFLSVRYFLKKREAWPGKLVELTRRDSEFWLWYPKWVIYMAVCYPLGLYDPFKSGDIHRASDTRQATKPSQ